MGGTATDNHGDRSAVNITVLSVTSVRAGSLSALASVEIEIGGVAIELHGIHALRVGAEGTRIQLSQFRDAAGLLPPWSNCRPRFTRRSATPYLMCSSSAA
jgi:hypothetical protein